MSGRHPSARPATPVTAERWAALEPLLDAALAAPPGRRDALLRTACGGDDALYADAASMLADCLHADGPGGDPRFDRPAAARFAALLATGGADGAAAAADAALAAALAGRYALGRELGRGGMGVVYQARDVRHGRDVALKVLRPDVGAGTAAAARFLDEIRVTAGLRHPHILPMFDSGVAAGRLYYVAPYVEGGTLRERLARGGALPLGEAVRVLREVADALAHAHARGVVHRDVKPENVLLGEGGAVVADFGIASAVARATLGGPTLGGAAAGAAADDAPAPNAVIGTPGYMAPEQALPDAPADHRADLYALGVVAYELLAGAPPFGGATPQALVAAHRAAAPPPLAARRPDAPAPLAALVTRLLAKRPEDRPPSARAVLDALGAALGDATVAPRPPARRRLARRVAAALPVAVAVAAGSAWEATPRATRAALVTVLTRADAPLDPRRVVVAPLENQTRDARLDAFGEMAADWITRALGRTSEFEVVDARTASTTARVVDRMPRLLRPADRAVALARETGAGTVVSGRYYADGDTVRVYVQLADAATGEVRRSLGPVSGAAAGLSALVDRVSRAAAAHMAAAVDTSAAGLGVGRSAPPSYDAYREAGRAWERFYAGDFPAAFARVARAAALDTTYMVPLVIGAYLHSDLRQWAAADSLLRRVAPHEADLSPVERAGLEMIRADVAGDLDGALRAAQELQRLAPASVETGTHVAHLAELVNRPRLALAALGRLDPSRGVLLATPFYWNWLTVAHHELGDHAAELAAARRELRQFPTRNASLLNVARAHGALGDVDAVRALPARATNDRWSAEAVRRRILVEGSRELRAHGHPDAARALLAAALALPAPGAVPGVTADEQRALLLAEAEQWGAARPLLERVLRAAPGRIAARGALGVVAARLGDRAAAGRAAAALAGVGPDAYARGRGTMWRARIAAALGDPGEAVRLVAQALGEGYPVMEGYASLPDAPHEFDYAEPSVHADPALGRLAATAEFRRVLAPRD